MLGQTSKAFSNSDGPESPVTAEEVSLPSDCYTIWVCCCQLGSPDPHNTLPLILYTLILKHDATSKCKKTIHIQLLTCGISSN